MSWKNKIAVVVWGVMLLVSGFLTGLTTPTEARKQAAFDHCVVVRVFETLNTPGEGEALIDNEIFAFSQGYCAAMAGLKR